MTIVRSPLHVTDDGEVPFTKPVKGVAATDPSHLATLAQATGGGAAWGGITGTLSAQTDLQTALNAKAPTANPTFTGIAVFDQAGSTSVPATSQRFARMQELADSQAAQDAVFLAYLAATYLALGGPATSLAMATARMLGRIAGGSGAVQEMTGAEVRAFANAAVAGHGHSGAEVTIDDSGFAGALAGAGITDVQALANWIDANITP